MEFIGSYYLPIIMFGLPSNIDLFDSVFKRIDNLTNKVDNLTAKLDYLAKVLSSGDKEDKKSIIEPTPTIEVIDTPTEPTMTIQQPINTPTTSTITPTEDRASILQKYKEIIARLQSQPKGSPDREQTLKEYREIKQKLVGLKHE